MSPVVALFLFLAAIAHVSALPTLSDQLFPVSIVHINDFHARFEETDLSASVCGNGNRCIGGYARMITTIKRLLAEQQDKNPIYLNAGDNFQGTIWYNVGRWNVTQHFLNLLPADVMTLGNHEFDHGIEGVVPFLETIKSPMVVANVDDKDEPTFQGKYNKSHIIEKYGRKIGVIGVILQTTDQIANTGKLKFFNESQTVKLEAERLKNEHNVDIIIVLSHCGLDVDKVIARNAGPLIDVIVGGHSHTFMYTGDNPPGPDVPRDEYPLEIIQNDGHKVLIVQASCYAKYVGNITVYFNADGEIESYEGAPIFLDSDIVQDPEVISELQPWKTVIDETGKTEIGSSRVTLSKSNCNYEECNLGNLVTDAFVSAYVDSSPFDGKNWTTAAISLCNAGGIRTTLNKGILTYAHLLTTLPFENTIDSFDLPGEYLLAALEYAVEKASTEGQFSSQYMLQVSGLKVTFNATREPGSRVTSVLVKCQNCILPKYETLDLKMSYRMVAASFLADGGDGFTMISNNKKNVRKGPLDIDALTQYLKKHTPIAIGNDERIKVIR